MSTHDRESVISRVQEKIRELEKELQQADLVAERVKVIFKERRTIKNLPLRPQDNVDWEFMQIE